MRSTNLNIYLIKNEYKSLDKIIFDYDKYEKIDDNTEITMSMINRCTYYKIVNENNIKFIKYKWIAVDNKFKDFYISANNITSVLKNNLIMNIIDLYKIDDNGEKIFFALKFGNDKMLNDDVIVRRFGIKTMLNIEGSLLNTKAINIMDVSQECLNTKYRHTKIKDIYDFDFSKYTNVLKGVDFSFHFFKKIGLIEIDKKQQVKANNSLSFKIRIKDEEIERILKKIYNTYKSDVYKKQCPWFDNIEPIEDKKLIYELNKKVIEKINNRDFSSVWMGLPYSDDEYSFSSIKFNKIEIGTDDIDIKDFVEVTKQIKDWDFLKKHKITLYDDSCCIGDIIYSCRASKFFYAEIIHNNNTYVLENDNWYFVKNNYKKEVEDFYENIKIWDGAKLPANTFSREDEYNEFVGNHLNNMVCVDKTILNIDANDKFEVADIISNEYVFYHVKKYGNSSQLGHLFSQGRRSFDEMQDEKNIENFKKTIIPLLKKKNAFCDFTIDKENVKKIKTVFCIISKKDGCRPNIPFFAKTKIFFEGKHMKARNADFYIYKIDESTSKKDQNIPLNKNRF